MSRQPPLPPDADHVWLTVERVAARQGVSRQAVTQAAREGRLPATSHAGRWWFRRDLLEMSPAARTDFNSLGHGRVLSVDSDLDLQWLAARSLQDLLLANIAFLHGLIGHTPVHAGSLMDESAPLVASLTAMNKAGFLTLDSQPGLVRPGLKQRAYVVGMGSGATSELIENALLGSDLVVLSYGPGCSGSGLIPVTVDDGDAFTWMGPHNHEEELEPFDNGSWQLMDELSDAWTLQVFDPVWGRPDKLWDLLIAGLINQT